MRKISYKCNLCYRGGSEDYYKKLICKDGLCLCKNCYEEYIQNDYKKISMLTNANRLYRRILSNIQYYVNNNDIDVLTKADILNILEVKNE